ADLDEARRDDPFRVFLVGDHRSEPDGQPRRGRAGLGAGIPAVPGLVPTTLDPQPFGPIRGGKRPYRLPRVVHPTQRIRLAVQPARGPTPGGERGAVGVAGLGAAGPAAEVRFTVGHIIP